MVVNIDLIYWKLSRLSWIESLYRAKRLSRFNALLLAQELHLISAIEAMYLNG